MEPQIQYCKTSDGVSIAYWTMGQGGVPLVISPPMLFSHIVQELRVPALHAWYERLASGRMIVRMDVRGQGMSQRNIGPVTRQAFVNDTASVIDALNLEQVDMASFYGPCVTHVLYAATNPDRVRRMALWSPSIDNSAMTEGQLRTVISLIESDWTLFTETYARVFLGWTGDLAHEWATFLRLALNQEDAAHLFAAVSTADVDIELVELASIRTPTLILYEALGPKNTAEAASGIAATIPGARLVALPQKIIPVYESEPGLRAVEDFLDDGPHSTPASAPAATPSGTAIILFADIADSTALTERLGDAAFREKARELDAALRSAITSNGGTAIEGKLLGDGVLATFGAAREAIGCAAQCHRAGSHAGLPLHVGIHAGDVIRESNNVYGGAVNIAARVAGEAAAGETLVSGTVRDLARTSAGVSFEDRGERELKGIGEPVRVWAVRAAESR